MRLILVLALTFIFSSLTLAAEPIVKITSFTYSSSANNHVAELCGSVSGETSMPTFVRVVVDETSKHPASYNTIAGTDGKFCLTVTTYYGTAVATLLP